MSPRLVCLLLAGIALSGCSSSGSLPAAAPSSAGTSAVSRAAPAVGACRQLTAALVAQPADDSPTVPCTSSHTAETYAVGDLPARLQGAAYDDRRLARFAYRTCTARLASFLGTDESGALRTLLTWAWFRPSTAQWEAGARWWRCDVTASTYAALPTTTRRLLLRTPDAWMACVAGATIAGSRVPCSQAHTWRAVTTIVLGDAASAYPGDAVVEARSKDYCSKSVGAWLGYPIDYDYGYTAFHAAEWSAGNRRSVCWARTSQ